MIFTYLFPYLNIMIHIDINICYYYINFIFFNYLVKKIKWTLFVNYILNKLFNI